MKHSSLVLCGLWLTLSSLGMPAKAAPVHPAHGRQLWVTAYYPVWHQEDGTFPPSKIDFTAISTLIHFAAVPQPDGTINDSPVKPNSPITPAESAAVLGPAHAAGCKVLLCVGGADTAPLFRPVLTDAVRPRFITSLVNRTVSRGYDGLDIDMEPIRDRDAPLYIKFIRELRARMNAAKADHVLPGPGPV